MSTIHPHTPPSGAMHRTVTALRRAIKAIHHVHPGHDDVGIAAAAESLAAGLESAGTLGIRQESLLRHTRSPLSGVMNPMAPPMTSEYHTDRVVSTVTQFRSVRWRTLPSASSSSAATKPPCTQAGGPWYASLNVTVLTTRSVWYSLVIGGDIGFITPDSGLRVWRSNDS
ncbi:MAG: hypothetical protein ACKOFT_04605, partial [Actinomycetota bacterium]